MAEIAAAGAALANGAGSLFSYNKDVFVFDQTLRQQKVHQIQNIRLQQVGLYREDLRDLFGLTISKMDNYLVVNTLLLGFCIALFYDGVLPVQNPPWLWWMWCLNLSGSTIFLLISIWLSLHASITAQSMAVKLLTQWLRLPLPRTEDIAAASATVEDYECCPVSSILRIPGLQRLDPRRTKADMNVYKKVDKDGRVSGEGDLLHHIHFKLFEHVQKTWQGYDAYARVCMAVGTNQLLLTLIVFALGSTLIGDRQPWAAWVFIVVVATGAMLHFRINLTLTKWELVMMVGLIYLAPLTAGVAATMDYAGWITAGSAWALASFVLNDLWILFVFAQAMESRGGLPEKFNTVDISSDVMSDNSMQHFVKDELHGLGIDAKNPGDFLWGTSNLSKDSAGQETVEKMCEREEKKLEKVFDDDEKSSGKLSGAQQDKLEDLRKEFQKIRDGFQSKAERRSKEEEESTAEDWVKMATENSGYDDSSVNYYVNKVTGDIRFKPVLRRSLSDTVSTASTLSRPSQPNSRRLQDALWNLEKSVDEFHEECKKSGDSLRSWASRTSSSESGSSYTTTTTTTSDHSSSQGGIGGDHEHRHRAVLDFQHYSLRPWSVYKQASIVVVLAWTVGVVWCVLDLLHIPTGNDIRATVESTTTLSNATGSFFVPVGMSSTAVSSDSLVYADAVSLWPARYGRGPEMSKDISDIEYVNGSLLVASKSDHLIDYDEGWEIKMPIRVDKVAYISEGRLAVSTPDNCLYLLQRDDDNDDAQWHRTAKIGDYSSSSDDDDIISGIAFSRDYDGRLLVLMRCGDIHIWNMSNGKRIVTHLTLPNVKRYTAIATTTRTTTTLTNKQQEEEEEYIMVSALGKDHQAISMKIRLG